MQFDHVPERGQKLIDVTRKSWGKQRILDEIEKCDVVCANCHSERTWRRMQG